MNPLELIAELNDETILRPPCHDDAVSLFQEVDANRSYLSEWLPWVDECTSPKDTTAFVERVEESHQDGTGLTVVLIHRNVIRGVVSLNTIDWINFNATIGYWLSAEVQGQGLMTLACGAMLDHMFNQLSLHRAEIRCAPGNIRSQGIPSRLGFTCEGTLREAGRLGTDRYVDLMVYSLLEQTWRNKP